MEDSKNFYSKKTQEIQDLNQANKTLSSLVDSACLQRIYSALGRESNLHLVGGLIRDVLLGIDIKDIDLCTSYEISDVIQKLEQSNIKIVETGIQHGTILAVVEQTHIEITTFRAGKPGNRGTILDDLSERDFTINAISYCFKEKKIFDPFLGINDLKEKVLRAVGDPQKRFIEDPLRILRAIRFGPAEGRIIEAETEKAIITQKSKLSNVAVERIRNEINNILLADYPVAAIRELSRLNLLDFTFPELIPTIGFEQNKFHTEDVFDHTMTVLGGANADLISRLSAIYHDIGKVYTLSTDQNGNRHFYDHEKISAEIAEKSMLKLKYSAEEIKAVKTIVALHMRPMDCGPSGTRRILRDSGEYYELWRKFKNADRPVVFDDDLLEQIKTNFDQMVQAELDRQVGSVYGKLAVNGDDLIKLGVKPGKKMGEILNFLKEQVIENPDLNSYDQLIAIARNNFGELFNN
jgi:tRNA nucleotidyltransferase (CCA-adding enzyme)